MPVVDEAQTQDVTPDSPAIEPHPAALDDSQTSEPTPEPTPEPSAKKQTITGVIREVLSQATNTDTALSHEDILTAVVEAFPEKDATAMMKTVKTQVPSRLRKSGLTIQKTVDGKFFVAEGETPADTNAEDAPKAEAKATLEAPEEPKLPAKKKRPRTKALVKDDPSGGRDVVYPEVGSQVVRLTPSMAKELLGYTEETETEKLKDDDVHCSIGKTRIHCANVAKHQRVFYDFKSIAGDILQGQFFLNGEVLSHGKHGWFINGKTRAMALILAQSMYDENPQRYPYWSTLFAKEEVSDEQLFIDVILITGVEESQKVIQTIDTGRPRSFADSLFSSGVFAGEKIPPKLIMKYCKVLEGAVRFVWMRGGEYAYAMNPVISHSDASEFLERHPGLVSAVRSVLDENEPAEDGEKPRLASVLGLGQLAGLIYMMSIEADEPKLEKYWTADWPAEKLVGLDRVETAEQFLTLLAGRDKLTVEIQKAIAEASTDTNANVAERTAIVINGFNAFVTNGKCTPAKVRADVEIDENGNRVVVNHPVIVGSIDKGRPE